MNRGIVPWTIAAALAVLLLQISSAQEAAPAQDATSTPEKKSRLVEAFDANSNGSLDPDELKSLRTELRDLFVQLHKDRAKSGDHDGADGQDRESFRARMHQRFGKGDDAHDDDKSDSSASEGKREHHGRDLGWSHRGWGGPRFNAHFGGPRGGDCGPRGCGSGRFGGGEGRMSHGPGGSWSHWGRGGLGFRGHFGPPGRFHGSMHRGFGSGDGCKGCDCDHGRSHEGRGGFGGLGREPAGFHGMMHRRFDKDGDDDHHGQRDGRRHWGKDRSHHDGDHESPKSDDAAPPDDSSAPPAAPDEAKPEGESKSSGWPVVPTHAAARLMV